MSTTFLTKKLKSLPSSPGVYIFKDKDGEILYVGKAASLKDRVGSYFQGQSGYARPIEMFIDQVVEIETQKTDTVLEAYILEQGLIKKLQPKYNAMGKDDKSFCYVAVTKEDFPGFVILRKTNLENDKTKDKKGIKYSKVYGPYISKRNIEISLKILRKIFPYHSKRENSEKGCLDSQIGLCPGPYAGTISRVDYLKNIRGIRMILEGKKKNLIFRMKKEMETFSHKNEFEKAAEIRNKIFSLQHIQDIALIMDDKKISADGADKEIRIEGYDISNISGAYATGSMVVFDSSTGELNPNKDEYRKFRIKTIKGANDVGAMEEVLLRRLKNNWPRPSLIILDGGAGHLNMARRVLRNFHLEIPLLAVAKGPERKNLDLRSYGTVPKISKNLVEQVCDEAHRFAISYHRKLRKYSSLK